MSWARFDDRCTSNPKVALLSDAAHRLWFTAICHACEHLTDGRIDREVPKVLPMVASGAKLRRAISELERRGLWEQTPTGWQIHDFLDWNPSGDAVRAKRDARAKAGRKGGVNRASGQATTQAKPKQLLEDCLPNASPPCQANANPVPVPVPVPVPNISPLPPSTGGGCDARLFGNFDEAMRVQIVKRAQYLSKNPHQAEWVDPQRWPEIISLHQQICTAMGWQYVEFRKPVKSVMTLVDVLATFTPEQISAALRAAPTDRWLTEGRKGVGCFSLTVVANLLNPERRRQGSTQFEAPTEDELQQRSAVRAAREAEIEAELQAEIEEKNKRAKITLAKHAQSRGGLPESPQNIRDLVQVVRG